MSFFRSKKGNIGFMTVGLPLLLSFFVLGLVISLVAYSSQTMATSLPVNSTARGNIDNLTSTTGTVVAWSATYRIK